MITSSMDFLVIINIVFGICIVVGGFSAFRNGRQTQLTKFQQDTNSALKERIDVLEGKIIDFEKENVIQRHIIETITSALKQRGFLITVDGDMVTIVDQNTGSTSHKKRLTNTVKIAPKDEDVS